MRQYGEVPPWLAAQNTPKVSACTGLGAGGAAAVQTSDSGGFGDVLVYIGAGWNTSGSVALTFPSAPPTLFIAGGEAFGTVSQNTVGNIVTVSWINASFVPRSQPYQLHYEWNLSK